MGALPEFVRRLKLTDNHMYLLCILIPLRHRLRILFSTLRTRQLVGTVTVAQVVHDST